MPVLWVSRSGVIFFPSWQISALFPWNLLLENRCLIKLPLGLQNPVIGEGAARMERCGNFWAWNRIVSGLNSWYFMYVLAPSSAYRPPIPRQHLLTGTWGWFLPLYHDQHNSLVGYTLRKVFFSFFLLCLTLNLFPLFHPDFSRIFFLCLVKGLQGSISSAVFSGGPCLAVILG